MELKSLLDSQNWGQGTTDATVMSQAMKRKINMGLKKLGTHYRRAILINVVFLAATLSIYAFLPVYDVLVPTGIVLGCSSITSYYAVWQYRNFHEIDKDQGLKLVLEKTLKSDIAINRKIQRISSVIFTCSFLGGFFLGAIVQGWRFENTLEKPHMPIIGSLLTIGFYFFTKTKSFRSFHRFLNPHYRRNRKFLEEQYFQLTGFAFKC